MVFKTSHLFFEDEAAVEWPRLTPDPAVAYDASVSWMPWNQAESFQISHCHVIGTMWLLAKSPYCEARKARSVAQDDILKVLDRNRFGFCDAMYVDELSEHELDPI
jgi:hypothetical protein